MNKYRMLKDVSTFKKGEIVWVSSKQDDCHMDARLFENNANRIECLWNPGCSARGHEEEIELIQDEQPDWFESLNYNEKEALRLIVAVSEGDECCFNKGPYHGLGGELCVSSAANDFLRIADNIKTGCKYALKSKLTFQKLVDFEKQKAELESQIEAIKRQIEDGV